MQVVGRPSASAFTAIGGGALGGGGADGILRHSTGALAAELYSTETMVPTLAWATMYTKRPTQSMPLFQLEGLVARRMELLAAIDQMQNSPKTPNTAAVVEAFAKRLEEEKRGFRRAATAIRAAAGVSSTAATATGGDAASPNNGVGSGLAMADNELCFNFEEDLISHLLCRFAFCMSEKWRAWFIRTEELLLRARLASHGDATKGFLEALLEVNKLPCQIVNRSTDPAAEKLSRFVAWRNIRDHSKGGTTLSETTEFLRVPMHIVPRMVKSREVLVHGGFAYVEKKRVVEVFVNIFKYNVARGLNDAWRARSKMMSAGGGIGSDASATAATDAAHASAERVEEEGGEDAENNLMAMLDSFLMHFIAEPADRLQVSAEGTVRPGDIQGLAQVHMPLCMRNIDNHLRANGHVKHHGRFQYGLFLKAIGLGMEDALTLFSTLMTVNGGGSVEAFTKSAYGYNIRHSYGREGKKTSYTSLSCASVVAMPPNVDRNDCHGCPFRFKDEAKLREQLAAPRPNPHSPATLPKVAPSPADIEDIVNDAKQMHYTRACYKYFMATHDGVKRDGLFRSPYEYYTVSREHEAKPDEAAAGAAAGGPSPARVGAKRTLFGAEASP